VFNKNFEPYNIKVPVNLEKINRPLGATQAKLKSCYSKIPVHIDSINRPLGATGVDLYGSWKFTEHSILLCPINLAAKGRIFMQS